MNISDEDRVPQYGFPMPQRPEAFDETKWSRRQIKKLFEDIKRGRNSSQNWETSEEFFQSMTIAPSRFTPWQFNSYANLNELRKRGVFISPAGVRSSWARRDLESFKKRLAAFERRIAQPGGVLTGSQVAALERREEDDVAHGEIAAAHPGCLVAGIPFNLS